MRTRIIAEPQPRTWRFGWFVAVGALAAVIVIVVVISRPSVPAAPAPLASRAITSATALLPSVVSGVSRTAAPMSLSVGRRLSGPGAASSPDVGRVLSGPGTNEPDVLIDPREQEGLRRLLAALNTGRVDPATLLTEGRSANEPLEPDADISIPPLTVDPLDAGGQ